MKTPQTCPECHKGLMLETKRQFVAGKIKTSFVCNRCKYFYYQFKSV
jgi:hypothetical protein